jgi:hypothetical protein
LLVARCQDKFEGDPDQYLAGRPAPEPMPEGTLYTCPMHPEIIQEGPGDGVVTLSAISLISAIEQQAKSLKSHVSTLTFIGEFRSI